jgi:glycosyltransferase involved in cell wall biosynthesis
MHPRVTILMGTCNGADFLPAQLDSFLAQQGADWALWVSDDGSGDATPALLAAFRAAHPGRDIRLLQGPGRGAAANFLSLLCHPDLPPGPVALADQDDVWLPHRLARGLDWLAQAGAAAEPVLYGSATWVTDGDLGRRRLSRTRMPRPDFANALVQNVIGGNTMILNAAAVQLMRRASAGWIGQGRTVPYHDWWIYLVLAGAGARIVIDAEPGLLYRQHRRNVMGASEGVRARLSRLRTALRGGYGQWIRDNAAALAEVEHLLTPAHRARAARFRAGLGRPGPQRLAGLRGIHRERRLETLALYLAALLGRV